MRESDTGYPEENAVDQGRNDAVAYSDADADADADADTNAATPSSSVNRSTMATKECKIHTHYIVLVHGWLGCPDELKNVKESIVNYSDKRWSSSRSSSSATSKIKICNITSNQGKTYDGVANGGQRVADEVLEFIRCDINKEWCDQRGRHCFPVGTISSNHHVTISFLGHSLGGLYARYAVSRIPLDLKLKLRSRGTSTPMDKEIVVHLHRNIFVTTATPHLGQSFNCFYRAPRFVEIIFGRTLKQTGLDLFFIPNKNSDVDGGRDRDDGEGKRSRGGEDIEDALLFQMATNYKEFLQPLAMFQKRVAYVNVFKSDFQVHTSTAGFFSDKSTYPHLLKENYIQDKPEEGGPSFVVATCTTERNNNILQAKTPSCHGSNCGSSYKSKISTLDLIMSNKLDALGWTKVFIDSRHKNPIKTMPKIYKPSSREMWNNFVNSRASKSKSTRRTKAASLMSGRFGDDWEKSEEESLIIDNTQTSFQPTINMCKPAIVVESKEILEFMTKNDRVQIPAGHNLIVANSKNEFHGRFSFNGLPMVDKKMHQLLNDVLDFEL